MLQTAVNCGNCSSDGSGNNAKHSREKPGNFVFEIEWEPYLSLQGISVNKRR